MKFSSLVSSVRQHQQRYVTSPIISALHGFTTRRGGLSADEFATLNLGLSSGDEPRLVESNRDLLLAQLGFRREQVCAFNQVHGARVLTGSPSWFAEDADAATSDDPNLLLVVSSADCLPLLFHDPTTGAVAAAHCGWRGTVKGLAREVVAAMAERHGVEPERLRVAIGPGVAGACYQVGPEVRQAFSAAGFPDAVFAADAEPGRYRLDLVAANRWVLVTAGVNAEQVDASELCTHCEADTFYSYRRDRGRTGRHWAFVAARPR